MGVIDVVIDAIIDVIDDVIDEQTPPVNTYRNNS